MKGLFATTSVLVLLLAGPALAQAPANQGGSNAVETPAAVAGSGGPQIIVKQPPPVTTIQPHAPNVTVQTGQPAANVLPSQKPDVSVAKPPAGTSDVNIGTTAPPATTTDRNRAPAPKAAVAPTAGVFPMAADVEKFIGKNVYGMQSNEIGKIENVLIGPEGRVRAAIVEFGGVLGAGENKVAVPWERVNIAGDRIMISIPEEQIKAEPRWSRDRPGTFAEFRPYR